MSDGGMELVPGQNVPVPEGQLSFRIETSPGFGVYCCALRSDQRAASPDDIVALGHWTGVAGSVSISSATAKDVVIAVDGAALPSAVSKLVFCLGAQDPMPNVEGSARFRISLSGGGAAVARFDVDRPRTPATFLGELYRRGLQWKFRALGQDFKTFADFVSFVGLSEDLLKSVLVAPPQTFEKAAAPVRLTRPPRPPRPLGADRTGEASVPDPDVVRRPADDRAAPKVREDGTSEFAASFALRGWILTDDGIRESLIQAVPGRRAVERELLDVKSDSEGGLWPGGFLFQPRTGERLAKTPVGVPTNGRSISATGLPELNDVLGLEPSGLREENGMPVGARLFASGGSPPRLVALDPREGRAWWKAPISGEWVFLGRCAPMPDLPVYALSAVGDAEGVFYAVGGDLVHFLGSQGSGLTLLGLGGEAVGRPFAIDGTVAVPIRLEGQLAIAVRSAGGEMSTVRVEGTPADGEPLGVAVGEPGSGRCFWVAAKGFIAYEEVEGTRVARWHAWPSDVEGLPFLLPYRAKNGRLWAFCVRVSGGGSIRDATLVCSMALAGAREVKELPGPFLSVGSQTFRNRERHRDPWSRAEEEINVGLDYSGRWLLPLVRLGERQTLVGLVDGTRGAATVRDFIFRETPAEPRNVALALHTDNGSLQLLRQSFEIASTDDLDLYRDAERICIHHSESNICVSWPLELSR